MTTGITTIRNVTRPVKEEAWARAEALGLPYYRREGTLDDMMTAFHLEGFLVYGKDLPYYYGGGGEYHYHFGTSVLRKGQMEQGHEDRLCRLLPDKEDLNVLDATFGQGGDSLTMSWFLGDRGHVTALEKSTALWEIGQAAIDSYEDSKEEELTRALRRITLIHEDFRIFLEKAEPKSFDVIYFDPMFKAPVKRRENNMEGFRKAAAYDSLTEEILGLAQRTAAMRIIVKERPFSRLFSTGLFHFVDRRKGQSTAYGVMDV